MCHKLCQQYALYKYADKKLHLHHQQIELLYTVIAQLKDVGQRANKQILLYN